MNPLEADDDAFDKLVEAQLRRLDRMLGDFDPDELEPNLAGDVLTLTLADGGKIIINRQRAARQLWMAAQRQAWHFDHDRTQNRWVTSAGEELLGTLQAVLSKALRRPIDLQHPAVH